MSLFVFSTISDNVSTINVLKVCLALAISRGFRASPEKQKAAQIYSG